MPLTPKQASEAKIIAEKQELRRFETRPTESPLEGILPPDLFIEFQKCGIRTDQLIESGLLRVCMLANSFDYTQFPEHDIIDRSIEEEPSEEMPNGYIDDTDNLALVRLEGGDLLGASQQILKEALMHYNSSMENYGTHTAILLDLDRLKELANQISSDKTTQLSR